MAGNFGKVNVSIAASTGGLTKGLSSASSQIRGFQGSIRRIDFAATFTAATTAIHGVVSAVRTLTGSLSTAVANAVSLGEEMSKSGVVFGSSASVVQQFSETANAIGVSQRAALQASGTFGNLFRAIGLSQGMAAEYSVSLVGLAADLASFNNTSIDDAMLALGAGLRGEAEPLRRFGVLLDDATLRQHALAMGLTSTLKTALTPSQKAQAAYNAILKQTTLAQGDFTRTSGSLANQQRIMAANFENISVKLGNAFLPLLTKLSKIINDSMPAIESFVSEWTDFLVGGANQFDGAAVSVDNFTASIRALSAELRTLRGYGDLLASLGGAVGAGGLMIAEDTTWLVGLRNLSEQFGKEAKVWAAATENLFAAAKERINNPTAAFDNALADRQADARISRAMEQARKARENLAALDRKTALQTFGPITKSVSGAATNAIDAAKKNASGLLIVARESALGFTRAAIGGLQQQSRSIISESLQALVVGTAEAEAFRNRMARGFDARNVEDNAARTANATEDAAATLNQIERLFNNVEFGLASIGV
jgi:hypothetical protein